MINESPKQPVTGLLRRRLIGATQFSFAGLARAWQEEAFRVESMLALLLLPLALWLPDTRLESALLIATLAGVLVVEVLNTAIEEAINRVGTEINPLSKTAKDLGSAAVMLSIVGTVVVWILILWP